MGIASETDGYVQEKGGFTQMSPTVSNKYLIVCRTDTLENYQAFYGNSQHC